jgi:putative Holliday junction resolvase
MRVLGLDIGSKRIGVALSDTMGVIAQGLETIQSKGAAQDLDQIVKLVEKNDVSKIVVGAPLNMDGSHSDQTLKVKRFVEQLEQRVSTPVVQWDERLTTMAAERTLLEADMSRGKRRKVVDKVAAVLILQGYLDYQSNRSGIE